MIYSICKLIFLIAVPWLLVQGSQDTPSRMPGYMDVKNTPTYLRGYGGYGYSPSLNYGNYKGSPAGWYRNSNSGNYRNYNYMPTASYQKNQRGDKGVFSDVQEGKYLPGMEHNVRSTYKGVQGVHSTYKGFSFPRGPTDHGVFASYGGLKSGKSPMGYGLASSSGSAFTRNPIYTTKGLQQTRYSPSTKNTGIYVVPTPSKLYYDGLNN